MKKILFVINEASYFFSHRLHIAKSIQALGWEVHVAVPKITEGLHEPFQKLSIHPHEFSGSFEQNSALNSLFELNGIVKKIGPDLVHLVTLKSSLRWFLLLPFVFRIKCVHTIAGFGQLGGRHWPARLGKIVMKLILAIQSRLTPSLYVVQNPADAGELCRQHAVPTARLFLVQGSGVDTELYTFPAASKIDDGFLHIGTACRRLTSKGLPALMDVARAIKAANLPIKLHVASVPASLAHREAIAGSEWNAWIQEGLFIDEGMVTDMPSYYQSLDAFIYLSTSGEGLAKTLLEAASSALPLITSTQPGCAEAVIDGETGYVVDPRYTEMVLDRLQSLLSDAGKRKAMGMAGRDYMKLNFADEIVTARMMDLYKKAQDL